MQSQVNSSPEDEVSIPFLLCQLEEDEKALRQAKETGNRNTIRTELLKLKSTLHQLDDALDNIQ